MERGRLERKVWQYVTDRTPSEVIFPLLLTSAPNFQRGLCSLFRGDFQTVCHICASFWPLIFPVVYYYSTLCFQLGRCQRVRCSRSSWFCAEWSYIGRWRSWEDQTEHRLHFQVMSPVEGCQPASQPASKQARHWGWIANRHGEEGHGWLPPSCIHTFVSFCPPLCVRSCCMYAQGSDVETVSAWTETVFRAATCARLLARVTFASFWNHHHLQ